MSSTQQAPRRSLLWLLAALSAMIVGLVLWRLSQTARPAMEKTPHKSAHVPGVPAWIPLYPGVAPVLDVSNDFPASTNGSLHFTAAATPISVAAFYREALPKAGLRITGDVDGQVNDTQGRILTAEGSGAERSLTLTVAPAPGGVAVTISFIERKPSASA